MQEFSVQDLFSSNKLQELDVIFVQKYNLESKMADLRGKTDPTSEFILQVAPLLETFIAQLFSIEDQCLQTNAMLNSHQPIIGFKKLYVLKFAKKYLSKLSDLPSWAELEEWRKTVVPAIKDQEWATANYAMQIKNTSEQEKMAFWCARALDERPALVAKWIAFKLPKKIDSKNLVNPNNNEYKYRAGFDYTDKVMDTRALQDQTHYCILCHPKQGDFCRIGFPKKKGLPEYRTNSLGSMLHGCPLEQHISEMNSLMQSGYAIAALAAAMINNPMLAATGHRICNDCMNSCIYQKQSPVDVPSIESAVLDIVLNLPWGIEIYYLLLRWNPLRSNQWLPKSYNGHKVAVMGMGPSGFTMAHHLLMEGCAVVGLDGQAMSPMPDAWHGPIYSYPEIKKSLPNRDSKGFGGVAEYGITARWDKNLLSVLRIVLERQKYFTCFSSIRFGGNWRLEDAWRQGFSHVVLAVGAGLPNVPNIPGALAPGMRTANDFLMALHLSDANNSNRLQSLDVKLPAIVIGGGLTAVDTATELQAFYLQLVERVACLLSEGDYLHKLSQQLSKTDFAQVKLWLSHGQMLAAEKRQAIKDERKPNLIKLLHLWGGVRIVYRKQMSEAPAYRENHYELASAMSEGVLFQESLEPKEILLCKNGKVSGVRFKSHDGEEHDIQALSVWSAIGSKLNVAYSFEYPGTIEKDSAFSYKSFKWSIDSGLIADSLLYCKDKIEQDNLPVFTSVDVNAGVSFIGDTHPAFHGSVVKAMSSAKRAYPSIIARINAYSANKLSYKDFKELIFYDFMAWVDDINACWLTIKAPQVAKNWQPGMFCRLLDKIVVPILAQGNKLLIYCPDSLDLSIGQAVAFMGPSGVRFNIDQPSRARLWIVDHSGIAFVLSLLPKIKKQNLALVLDFMPNSELLEMLKNIDYKILAKHDSATQLAQIVGEHAISEIALFTKPELAALLKDIILHAAWFNKSCRFMGQAMGPMQCALKGVCAQCLQWQIDPETKQRTKAVYSCSWQHQPLEMIDLSHAHARQELGFSLPGYLE